MTGKAPGAQLHHDGEFHYTPISKEDSTNGGGPAHCMASISTRVSRFSPRQQLEPESLAASKSASFLHWWYADILAVVAALASLGAIIGVLAAYDGRPLTDWPIDVLTINGLIAILATALRGAMIAAIGSALSQEKWNWFTSSEKHRSGQLADFAAFDHASRGLWGSLLLLWRFKASHMACLGAAVAILSVATSTFSQQLISLEDIRIPVPTRGGGGIMPRSTFVENAVGWSGYIPAYTTQLAIMNGYMASTVEHVPTTCSTGNCTWPMTPTVGVCGACVDRTADINKERYLEKRCRVRLDKLELSGYCDTSSDMNRIFTIGPGTGRVFDSLGPEGGAVRFDSPHVIGSFTALGLPYNRSLTSGLATAQAGECSLWYCIQAETTTIENGVLQATERRLWAGVKYNSPAALVVFADIPGELNIDSSEEYIVGAKQMSAMISYARSEFIGNVSADDATNFVSSNTNFAESVQRNFDDLNTWIDRFALSMSNEVRMQNPTSNENARYQGVVFSDTTHIVVRWQWITYLAALVSLTVAYLAWEMVRTSRLDVLPWKSEALLPLCIDVDDNVKMLAARGLAKPNGVQQQVGELRVRLWTDNAKGTVRFTTERS